MDVAGFIDLLTDSGLDVTPLEVAEALWLARYASPPPSAAGVPAGTPPESTITPEPPADAGNAPDAPARVPVYLPVGAGARQARLAGTGMPVPIPASTAMPGSLGLVRELRPLKLRVPDPRRRTLDVAATISATASSGILLPVLRAASERRFSLALVVDTGPAMAVWAKLEAELLVALQRLAAFRDLRRWYLHSRSGEMIGISHSARASPAPRDCAELLDPAGRRLILVLTDGAGAAWYSGAMARALRLWGGGAPVAIVQPLPQQLWTRTALSPVRGRLTATRQAAPNARLMFTPRRRATRWNGEPEEEDQAAVPVPVLGIGPGWLRGWARLVGGTPASTLDCAVTLASSGTATRPAVPAPASADVSAEDRVRRFVEQASPEAQRLASYLAATPLSLPVMRHVQHSMLPGSGPAHLAEVLLGGLVTTSGVPGDHDEPRRWRYEFAPGVRDLLLSGLGRGDAGRVLTTVSRDLNARLGRGADEFTGVVPLPGRPPGAAVGRPFAEIYAQVLERITGEFGAEPAGLQSAPATVTEQPATLIRRYQRTGRVADIDAAIAALRGTSSKLELAAALRARYLVLADPDDLDAAIGLLDETVRDPVSGPAVAEQLASALGLRHARTGSPADLDDAVAAAELAVDPVTEQDDQFPRYAATLAGLLVRRGYPDDLAAAVSWLRRAVTHQAARDDQARLLAGLSVALRALAGASGTDIGADLDEAITSMRLAIQLGAGAGAEPAYGSEARELAERQAGLGGALLDRGQHSGNLGDLSEAAECYRAAAALGPPRHPETAAYLAAQGTAMRLLAASGGQRDDADQAVRLMRQAIAETAPLDPELPRRQAELATSLIARFGFDGHRGDLLEARQLLAEAIAALSATLGARSPETLAARVELARVTAADGRTADALAILGDVVSSLPRSHSAYRDALALVESLR